MDRIDDTRPPPSVVRLLKLTTKAKHVQRPLVFATYSQQQAYNVSHVFSRAVNTDMFRTSRCDLENSYSHCLTPAAAEEEG